MTIRIDMFISTLHVNGLNALIKKYPETNENVNVMIQNLWYTAKAVLKAKFIGIQSYLEKREKSQINNLSLHLKQREKDKQNLKLAKGKKPQRAEINETGTKNTLAKINETKS